MAAQPVTRLLCFESREVIVSPQPSETADNREAPISDNWSRLRMESLALLNPVARNLAWVAFLELVIHRSQGLQHTIAGKILTSYSVQNKSLTA